MKTPPTLATACASFLHCAGLFLALTLLVPSLRAVPEPSTVLYGLVSINGVPVDASRVDVVIEARRTGTQTVITSYTMGSAPLLGDYYRLTLPMESTRPTNAAFVSIVGDSVDLRVLENGVLRGQATYVIPARGAIQRVDLGTAGADLDGNGLPDLWETTHFGAAARNPDAVVPGSGRTVRQMFVDGSTPSSTNAVYSVSVLRGGAGQTLVTFPAQKAEGPGYEGLTRLYALEASTNFASGWFGVPGFTNVVGNNQTVTFTQPATNVPHFFRGRVWLE